MRQRVGDIAARRCAPARVVVAARCADCSSRNSPEASGTSQARLSEYAAEIVRQLLQLPQLTNAGNRAHRNAESSARRRDAPVWPSTLWRPSSPCDRRRRATPLRNRAGACARSLPADPAGQPLAPAAEPAVSRSPNLRDPIQAGQCDAARIAAASAASVRYRSEMTMTISCTGGIVRRHMKLTLEASARVNLIRSYSPPRSESASGACTQLHRHSRHADCRLGAGELRGARRPLTWRALFALRAGVVLLGTGPTQRFAPQPIRAAFARARGRTRDDGSRRGLPHVQRAGAGRAAGAAALFSACSASGGCRMDTGRRHRGRKLNQPTIIRS